MTDKIPVVVAEPDLEALIGAGVEFSALDEFGLSSHRGSALWPARDGGFVALLRR